MTESSPVSPAIASAKEGAVFYGSAKAEQAKTPKKESTIVSGVKKALNSWLERVGPKSVENHFVKAHQNILNTLTDEQRKKTYEQSVDKWKRAGKIVGISATVLDASLATIGAYLTIKGWQNPMGIMEGAHRTISTLTNQNASPKAHRLGWTIQQGYELLYGHPPPGTGVHLQDNLLGLVLTTRDDIVNKSLASAPGLITLQTAAGFGPSKILAHIAASGAETVGKMKAKTYNYVDSGKAAEHASKVGNAIGKAATETAKYVAEHPDEIRKTVETVSRVKRQNAESAQKLAEAKQKATNIALEKEYQDWIAHHPDKAYYENSGLPYPSKAEYVAKKQEEETKRKANKEAEIRGMAKDSPKH